MTRIALPTPTALDPGIRQSLAALRRRLQWYVVLEGVVTLIAAAAVWFWVSLAVDWLLEPSRGVRIAILVGLAALMLTVVYRKIVRRLTTPLGDRSLALLLERRFPELNDGLLTAVELSDAQRRGQLASPGMLATASQRAAGQLARLDIGTVINREPLGWAIFGAVVLTAAVAVYAAGAADVFGVWARRNVLLADELWPRRTRLEVDGFVDGHRKVARGSDTLIVVRADATKEIPEVVELRYETEEGVRGRATMRREGEAVPGRDAYQEFAYTFEAIPSARWLDVRGGDSRIRDLHLQVVDSPTLSAITLDFEFPTYTGRTARGNIDATSAMQVPRGATITLRARANKPLKAVEVKHSGEGARSDVEHLELAGSRAFTVQIDQLLADRGLEFTLHDGDGLENRQPIRLSLSAMPDNPPQIALRPEGIGAAITPQARLPFVGTIGDDYGVVEAWFHTSIDGGVVLETPLRLNAGSALEREVREAFEATELGLLPGQQLTIHVVANDNHDLAGEGAQLGEGEVFTLDVVTPEELRAILESRELNLRRRFETILAEVQETRDRLAGINVPAIVERNTGEPDSGQNEPDDGSDDSSTAASDPTVALATLTTERSVQNGRKNAEETRGVAASFEQIGQELINNRIPSYQEHLSRLLDGIAQPLHRIADDRFPELEVELVALREALAAIELELADSREDSSSRVADAALAAQDAAVAQADAILSEMQLVLARMLELETFNELVELLREVITDQETIATQTQAQRRDRLRDLIEDEE